MGNIKPVCAAPDCGQENYATGYCEKHYKRLRRTGTIHRERHENVTGRCTVPGCGGKHYGRGYCSTHYRRLNRTGQFAPSLRYQTDDDPLILLTPTPGLQTYLDRRRANGVPAGGLQDRHGNPFTLLVTRKDIA